MLRCINVHKSSSISGGREGGGSRLSLYFLFPVRITIEISQTNFEKSERKGGNLRNWSYLDSPLSRGLTNSQHIICSSPRD